MFHWALRPGVSLGFIWAAGVLAVAVVTPVRCPYIPVQDCESALPPRSFSYARGVGVATAKEPGLLAPLVPGGIFLVLAVRWWQ